ncbi:MAG: hypothetical protein JOZ16_07785 [Methylobacteriaceae bacterium]|nr:hypothetical protein [Methylobacteriaceae bacterium]
MLKRTLGMIPREVIVITDRQGRLITQPGIDLNKFANNIAEIREHIEAGRELPPHFYRASPGRDYLLEDHGWLHLHVGHGIDDSVLLIIEPLEDRVIFIALTDHGIFHERPRAKSLRGLGSKIAKARLPKST